MARGTYSPGVGSGGGWFLGRSVATESALTADGLHVLMFLDTWGQVSGPEYAFPYIRIEENPNVYNVDGGLSFYCGWIGCRQDNPGKILRVYAKGSADKASGKVDELSVHGEPVGPLTEEKLLILQPFFEALIGVFDPSLSSEERADVLRRLKLRPVDVEALRALMGDDLPRLTLNGIEYSVHRWGSEEGGTVELQARVLEPSGGP
ncbi:MAG: hypothetical protein K6U08_00345 [Firmicutes bacterium]|nr:hypothetical protein [Bacillota bacterium]